MTTGTAHRANYGGALRRQCCRARAASEISDVFSSKPGAILFAEPRGGPIRILRVEAGEGEVGYVYHSAGALWIARGAEDQRGLNIAGVALPDAELRFELPSDFEYRAAIHQPDPSNLLAIGSGGPSLVVREGDPRRGYATVGVNMLDWTISDDFDVSRTKFVKAWRLQFREPGVTEWTTFWDHSDHAS